MNRLDSITSFPLGKSHIALAPNDILCGIIAYIDKLAIDKHGHLSLEPIYFTLSIFNHAARNKPEAWRPLGYIPNLHLMSAADVKHSMSLRGCLQLYHDSIADIFSFSCPSTGYHRYTVQIYLS